MLNNLIPTRWKILIALGAIAGATYGAVWSDIAGWGVAISYGIAGALGMSILGLLALATGLPSHGLDVQTGEKKQPYLEAVFDRPSWVSNGDLVSCFIGDDFTDRHSDD